MKTNVSTLTTTPQYTLTEAVTEAVNTLKSNGSFSAHDITVAVREAVNEGEYALPGYENPNTASDIKYLVNHDDVKNVLNNLERDGVLANLGLNNVDYSGAYRVYNFDAPVTSTDDADAVATPAPDAAADSDVSADEDVSTDDSPVAVRVRAYLDNVGSATLKQVQSTLKVNGLTCKDLATLCDELGYTVTPGTEGCFSTYTVEA